MASIPTTSGTLPARRPAQSHPAIEWAKKNLFSSWLNSAVSALLLYLIITRLIAFIDWGFINAIWSVPVDANGRADTRACREIKGIGACWALITEKQRFILFGTYPYDQHWRPLICIFLFIGLYVVSTFRQFWNWRIAAIWVGGLTVIGVLMWGGVFGMPFVDQERWGGLPITLILATFGIAFAFPLGIVLALGRRSKLPAISTLCVVYIELIRGVPLISVLFMASVMFPLFLPEGLTIDKLLRAQVGFILFSAAYLAEVVRGGLQAIPKGQAEAADSLGLPYWQKTAFIILPQALRLVIPPMVNLFIGVFKDTSLVVIIGIFDLLNAAKTAVVDPAWQGFGLEAYVFVSVIYFVFCFAMSKYSQNLETEFNRHRNR